MSNRQIAQELECNFNMSGETVFHQICRKWKKDCVSQNKLALIETCGYEECKTENTYMLTADVARGDGQDYSTLIFKIEDGQLVAEYRGKLTPDIFAQLINQTGREFGECMVVVENNLLAGLCYQNYKYGYPNIYYSRKSTHEMLIHTYQKIWCCAWLSTTMKTRPLIIAKMEEFVRNKLINIKSKRLFNEITFYLAKRKNEL